MEFLTTVHQKALGFHEPFTVGLQPFLELEARFRPEEASIHDHLRHGDLVR